MGLTQFLEAGAAVGSVLVSSITAIRSKKDQQISQKLIQEQNRLNQEQNRINRVYSKIEARQKVTEIRTNHIISLGKNEINSKEFVNLRAAESDSYERIGEDLNRWAEKTVSRTRVQNESFEEALRCIDFNRFFKIELASNGKECVIVERYEGAAVEQKESVQAIISKNTKHSFPFASLHVSVQQSDFEEQKTIMIRKGLESDFSILGHISCDLNAIRKRCNFDTIHNYESVQPYPIKPVSDVIPKKENNVPYFLTFALLAFLLVKRIWFSFKQSANM